MSGLMILAAILAVMWLVGLVAFKTVGFLIHILLVAAIVIFVVGLLTGRRAV